MNRGHSPSSGRRESRSGATQRNVGEAEQWISLVGGGALALYGLLRLSPRGVVLAAIGGALALRGATGHCPLYQAMGVDTSTAGIGRRKIRTSRAIKVEQRITVKRSPEELYAFWRNFENLPRFMQHLESVSVMNHTRSRWVVKAPLGTTVTWDAEIIHEKPNEVIGWQSLGGADVDNAGSVQFTPMSGKETEVKVTLQYDPPGGMIGTVMAKIMGDDPEEKIAEDLRRFKEVMEAGETAAVGKEETAKI